MRPPEGSPPWLAVHTAAERPELWDEVREEGRFDDVWPEYNMHGRHTGTYFSQLTRCFADLQALLVDDRDGEVVGRARTIPFAWSGRLAELPEGIDALGLDAVSCEAEPTTLSALAAEVVAHRQGERLSRLVLRTMADLARRRGLDALVAPVRPSRKDRYPLMPIERYAAWRRDDGPPFDPWLRVHARLGASIVGCAPRSLEITAPVAEWEAWTGLELPGEGTYVFPGGLAPVEVLDGVGTYFEPNVWMVHALDGAGVTR
jgi:GNAT superfamily N-acetyltransferase